MANFKHLFRTAAFFQQPSWRWNTRPSSGATEKSVPYQKTLKEDSPQGQGPTKPLPASASVVVVGGGSIGCQTVYHLAKMGVANVVLLERDRLTSGTTWHTAGEHMPLIASGIRPKGFGLVQHPGSTATHKWEMNTNQSPLEFRIRCSEVDTPCPWRLYLQLILLCQGY